ncbi:SDR family NAD(P)-dependent oxidoreductase [sulfur-oxidizing endosymbiont of Gigantopelta aegis]|uniref:SDR family NAD(P)-dependent oxidoreductase n=1 Tax=sulfur-oxidizing endosymbiont of Gigantopelta aegis TaxID=2794934 RepID=UPI0018DD946A|nr:SDR family oxidoreductase [sulfur-oxidizing endosymbiont of Gigantopelta aegis]
MLNDGSEKKLMLITGTSKGIGLSLAQRYLQEGFRVIGCSRSRATIEHEDYAHYSLDVSDEEAIIKMVKGIKQQQGVIDVLLNNAGMASMNHLLTTTLSKAKQVFDSNFFATFLLTREVAKQMMRKKSGNIINYSTVAVPLNLEGEAIYAASKAAIESLTKISAKELGPLGIRVNAIAPTPVQTDLIKMVPQEKIDNLLESQVIKRFGTVDDIKNVIDFFIAEKSQFITGQIIYLGGVMR